MMKTSNPIKKLKDFDFLLRCLLVCYKTYYDQLFFVTKFYQMVKQKIGWRHVSGKKNEKNIKLHQKLGFQSDR